MIRRNVTRLALVGTILAAAFGAATPASASYYRGCVSRYEYNRIHTGNSMSYVHRRFGTSGRSYFQYNGYYTDYQDREYRVCGSSWGFVFVDYERDGGSWHVSGKSAYWG